MLIIVIYYVLHFILYQLLEKKSVIHFSVFLINLKHSVVHDVRR